MSSEAVTAISRQLLLDETRHYSFQPAFRPPEAMAKHMQNGHLPDEQPATCSAAAAAAQEGPAQQRRACSCCEAQTRQGVCVLTLSAHDAVWPLLAAAQQLKPAAAAPKSSQPSNGRLADGHEQPNDTIDLAEELVQVAGPAAALEPHIVLVWGAQVLHRACHLQIAYGLSRTNEGLTWAPTLNCYSAGVG